MATYVMLRSWNYNVESFNVITLVSLATIVFMQALAVSTLSITITAELLPENLREFGLPFCNAVLATSAFIELKLSLSLSEIIGLHGLFFVFGGFCVFGTLFIIFYMPETKGRKYGSIMKTLRPSLAWQIR